MTSEAIGYLALVLAALGILAGLVIQWRSDRARRARAARLAARLDYVIRDPRALAGPGAEPDQLKRS